MPQITACRACLAENLNMYRVTNSPYKEIYEKLTNAKLGMVYPDTFCYICVSILHKFRKFSTLARNSNAKLQEWYSSETERKPATQPLFIISTTAVEYVSTLDENRIQEKKDKIQIKMEKIDNTIGEKQTIQFIESTGELYRYESTTRDDSMDIDTAWSDDEPEPKPIVKLESRKLVKTEKTPKGTGKGKRGLRNIGKINIKENIPNKNKTKRKPPKGDTVTNNLPDRATAKQKLTNDKTENEYMADNEGKKPSVEKKTNKIKKKYKLRKKLCDFCDYKVLKKYALKRHMKNKHPDITLVCFCGYVASTYTDLITHKIKEHLENEFICNTCGYKTTAKKDSLVAHMKIHNPKSIKCNLCDYKTSQQRNLIQHIGVVHSEEKNYMCHICNYRSSLQCRLATHLYTHKQIDEKRFKCEFCGQRFSRNEHLKRHVRIHTGEKPYACSECGQRFNQDGAMKLHLKRHYQA